jgi:hypothetical protein
MLRNLPLLHMTHACCAMAHDVICGSLLLQHDCRLLPHGLL